MNVNENTIGPYLRFNYSDKGSAIVKYTFNKINFAIVLLKTSI